MTTSRFFFRPKRGAAMVMMAGAAILVFGCLAIVTDIGWMYYQKARLQTAVNAGWKAGFDEVMKTAGESNKPLSSDGKGKVTNAVRAVIEKNGYKKSEADQVSITVGENNKLTVDATLPVGLFFAQVLNFKTANVSAQRVGAPTGDEKGGTGIVPLGIPHGVIKDMSRSDGSYNAFGAGEGFKENQEYILKLGAGAPGQPPPLWEGDPAAYRFHQKNAYGPLDPDNGTSGGASDYGDRLMYGFNRPIEINDRIIYQGGNMTGDSDMAVTYRVTHDPPLTRVIIPITDIPPEVPVNNPQNAEAKTVYDLQGVDNSGGEYDPTKYAFGAAVRVIGFAEFEITPVNEWTRSGTNYDLGDSGDLGPYQSGQIRGKFIRYVVKPGDVPLE